MKGFGEKLIKLRGKRSRNEVKNALGISLSALTMYENEERVPRDKIKLKIAKYYGTTVQQIFFTPKCHETRHNKESTYTQS